MISIYEANAEMVMLTYRENNNINGTVDEVVKRSPVLKYRTPDNIVHKLWKMTELESKTVKHLFASNVNEL